MKSLGDFDVSAVVYGKFSTFRPSSGAAYTLAGSPVLSVYKDNSTTQSTTGVTLTADFDSVTGLNHFAIDTSADGTFYAAGSFFDVVITTGTVDSVSVVGAVVASFTIRKNSALKPTTAGRTLVVDSSGLADANTVKIGPTGSGTAQTARDIGASVLLSSGTGTGQLDFTSGVVKANVTQLLGTAWLTPGTAGTPDVNVKLWNGLATVALPLVPTTAGRTLDVSAGGEAGVDWANVGSPTTTLALTGTTIATTQKVDVETIKTNPVVNAGTITFPTGATLASTTNITGGTITTTTNLTNLPAITSNWLTAAGLATDAAQEIAGYVWDVTLSGHLTSGTTGNALNAAGSAGDPWSTALPGAYGAGSAGYIIGTNLNATVTSRMATFTLPTNFSALAITSGGIVQADLQTIKTQTVTCSGGVTIPAATLASTTNITTVATVTTLTNLPAITANWLTATGIAANAFTSAKFATNALDAVWSTAARTLTAATNITSTGAAVPITAGGYVSADIKAVATQSASATSDVNFDSLQNLNESIINIPSLVWDEVQSGHASAGTFGAYLNAAITSRMASYTQPTGFLAATFPTTVASTTNITAASGVRLSATGVDDIWDEVQSGHTTSGTFGKYLDAQVSTISGGGGASAADIADAVWDEVISGHLTAGSTGAKLNSAASAGDPWSTSLPGSYASGTAGYIVGTISSGGITVTAPVIDSDQNFTIIRGDDYYSAESRNLSWTLGASPDLTGATISLYGQAGIFDYSTTTGSVSGAGTATQIVSVNVPSSFTSTLLSESEPYALKAVLSNGHIVTLAQGTITVTATVE